MASAKTAYAKWKAAFDKPENREFVAAYTYKYVAKQAYLGTIVGFKPDPLGRYPLMDVYSSGHAVYLLLTGGFVRGGNPVVLAGAYIDEEADYLIDGQRRYVRQHSIPGARMTGQGWGAAVYMASAWMARRIEDGSPPRTGTTSPVSTDEYQSRSEEADALWDSLVKRGIAIRAQMTTDETPDKYLWDFLRYTQLWDTGLLVWANGHDSTATNMSWLWDGTKRTALKRFRLHQATKALDETYFYGGKLKKTTAERLARSYHGDSPKIVTTIAGILLRDGYGKLAKQYLQRVDIMAIAGDDPEYKKLAKKLPRGAAPKLFGLDAALHEAAASGKVKVNWNEENPLHLPPISPETKRESDEFPSY